jgi:hypothetical protein
MAPQPDHSHRVRTVVLPSGKTIELVYFGDELMTPSAITRPHEAHHAEGLLHVCGGCGSELVQPLDWHEEGTNHWSITLRCPDCEWVGTGVFDQAAVERYDIELDRGTEALMDDLEQVAAANMLDDIERFCAALQADAILPEDF